MSASPVVSIVGRPNVGKSTLFNRILGRRAAVVDNAPGVTRDRNYQPASWCGHEFTLIDTGGLIPTARDAIPVEIHKHVDVAVDESAVIIFLVEAGAGPTDLDLLIARRLKKRRPGKVILVANKAESEESRNEAIRHMALGCGEPEAISALLGQGVGDLLDRVCSLLDESPMTQPPSDRDLTLSIAVVGRPNAGKSSLVNKLLRSERMIVDHVPGTTRDAIDSFMVYKGNRIRLIDTAGLRRKSQVRGNIEYYCNLRALDSIGRCDVCILMVDAAIGLGEQDLKITAHVHKSRKGMVVCFNKWDLVHKDEHTFDRLVAETRRTYAEMQHVPIISTSAVTGQRVLHTMNAALQVHEQMGNRVPAADLRDTFFAWTRSHTHPVVSGKQVKFLGIKQIKTAHPRFVCFCTNPGAVVAAYRRYIVNNLHEKYDFFGCTVVLEFRSAGHHRAGHRHMGTLLAKEET